MQSEDQEYLHSPLSNLHSKFQEEKKMCTNCKGNYYITTPIYYPSSNLEFRVEI